MRWLDDQGSSSVAFFRGFSSTSQRGNSSELDPPFVLDEMSSEVPEGTCCWGAVCLEDPLKAHFTRLALRYGQSPLYALCFCYKRISAQILETYGYRPTVAVPPETIWSSVEQLKPTVSTTRQLDGDQTGTECDWWRFT